MTHRCAQRLVARPAIADVHAVLVAWGGIIVHFSGVPRGVSSGYPLSFPYDLRNVVDGNAQGGLSCSTVRAGDRFEVGWSNATGCVGVIVRGRSPWSLVGAYPGDGGTSLLPESSDRYCNHADHDLQIEDVELSLLGRMPDHYNEWILRDYDALGLLAQPPLSVIDLGQQASPADLLEAAGGLPIFCFHQGQLYEVDAAIVPKRMVTIADLYPCD